MVIQATVLDDAQARDVEALVKRSEAHDGASPCIQMDHVLNFHKAMSSWFLAYEEDGQPEGRLVGASSVFAPMRDEAEVSLCVDPERRRSGLGTALLEATRRELSRHGIATILLVCDDRSGPGKGFLTLVSHENHHIEYTLVYEGGDATGAATPPSSGDSATACRNSGGTSGTSAVAGMTGHAGTGGVPGCTPAPREHRITIRRGTLADIDEMARVSADGFGESPEENVSHIRSCFADEGREAWLGFLTGTGSAAGSAGDPGVGATAARDGTFRPAAASAAVGGCHDGAAVHDAAAGAVRLVAVCYLVEEDGHLTICGVVVDKQERDRGIGTAFLTAVIAEARTRKLAINIEVDSINARAYHLYRKLGFREMTVTNYLRLT